MNFGGCHEQPPYNHMTKVTKRSTVITLV